MEEGLIYFDRGFLRDMGRLSEMPPPRFFGGYRVPFGNDDPADCCTQQFSRETLYGSKYAI